MFLRGKNILVTGATGSFGKAFINYILRNSMPSRLCIYSRDELKQYEIKQKIKDKRLRYFIGDVRDKERLNRAMHGIDVIIHAAALKQIDTAEYNPYEIVKTNIIGSQNIIETAIDNNVEKAILLSSDKAVNPTSLYGTTKLAAERLFVQGNAYASGTKTKFSCVRYGNVLGSRGSVVPVFLEQRKTGIITITHKDMTRFFLTLDEAVQLVLVSLDKMSGGEIFIPKIPSMKIIDLAEVIAPECQIKFIGRRTGEKLHETLISSYESPDTIERDNLFIILPRHEWFEREQLMGEKVSFESYKSDTNTEWLSESELLKKLGVKNVYSI